MLVSLDQLPSYGLELMTNTLACIMCLGPMFYAIVRSDNDFFRECYGTLWNFTFGGKVPELYGTF